MINAERFKEEINKFNNNFGLADNIVDCETLGCRNCKFSNFNNSNDEIIFCTNRKVKWLLSEYNEPVKLTRLEYEILKWLSDKDYKYIARDSGGGLDVYYEQPPKKDRIWGSAYGYHFSICDFRDLFHFVKWEDSTPTSIQEVLENCEVTENAENR